MCRQCATCPAGLRPGSGLKGRSPRPSAFTLLELVTVMVILAVLALVVGGPTFTYLNGLRAGAAASRLASDVRYVQRLALGSGLRTWVVVDDADDEYSLYMEDPANPGEANRLPVVHPLDQTTSAVRFGSGPFSNVSITSVDINATSELEFDSFGVPYDASGAPLATAAEVVLSDGAAVRIHPVGGLVEHVTWP